MRFLIVLVYVFSVAATQAQTLKHANNATSATKVIKRGEKAGNETIKGRVQRKVDIQTTIEGEKLKDTTKEGVQLKVDNQTTTSGEKLKDGNQTTIGEKLKDDNQTTPVEKGELVFSDEFNTFDLKTWKHDITLGGGGNWEFQQYSNNRSNSFVRDGVLTIQPTLMIDKLGTTNQAVNIWGTTPASTCTSNMFYGCERQSSYANPVMSAKISTYNSFSIKYGRVEVRAKLPRGDWLWPAIWMLPKYEMYGGWPASGEIDIMEGRGNGPSYIDPKTGKSMGVDSTSSALHWGTDWKNNKFEQTVAAKKLAKGNYSDDFHTFGMVWNENQLYTYVDSDENRILEIDFSKESFWKKGKWHSAIDNPWAGSPNNAAPFDQEFYLIMNVAVGGTNGFFPDGLHGKPWGNNGTAAADFWKGRNSWLPSWNDNDNSLKVDWVKVYKS